MLSQYTTKWKYTLKIIQIITKLDDVFSHVEYELIVPFQLQLLFVSQT